MPQELDAFFKPIDAYFEASGLTDLSNATQERDRILILESAMGDACDRKMTGMAAVDKTTYARYKAAIKKRFLTQYDPVHIMGLIFQCVMKSDESTKDYVTHLWALASRLADMPDVWRERMILTAMCS
jgi:hypothetical protein